MTKEYEQIRSEAVRLGYQELTKLQQKVFQNEDTFDFSKWLMVVGATSSGKTLVALLVYFYHLRCKKKEGKPFRMLFAVPYRALAAQKTDEIMGMVKMLDLDLKVVQSTGEFRNDDMAVRNAEADIAVIIYEKVFMFASMDSNFLPKYDLLVMDEIGLTQDQDRGVKADFILTRARLLSSLRVLALATPFFNWKNYIQIYGFTQLQEDERPVKLETYPIYYGKERVNYVKPGCPSVECFEFPVVNQSGFQINPWRKVDAIIKKICMYHLQRGNKILIFENNRNEVKRLARRLGRSLREEGILSEWIPEKDCRKYIREWTGIQSEEELYGIMEQEDYLTFAAGIGYHNADMPVMLRSLVEKEFLQRDGRLQIVCSTETLVYGINSPVDVVVIPSMIKQCKEGSGSIRFLYPNEYMNYAGRAGRLDMDRTVLGQEKVGYIYPFLKANYHMSDDRRLETDQKLQWEKMLSGVEIPPCIVSHFFSLEAGQQAFYILSLFPNDGEGKRKRAITESELEDVLKYIPHTLEENPVQKEAVHQSLSELWNRKLIYIANDCEDEDEEFIPKYILTDVGQSLTGYIMRLGRFDSMQKAVCECIVQEKIEKADLFNAILFLSESLRMAKKEVGILTAAYPQLLEKTVKNIEVQLEKRKEQMSDRLYKAIKRNLKSSKECLREREYKTLVKNQGFIMNRLLFALLMWTDGNCTIRQLHDTFEINYMQMSRFAETLSYQLDIMCLALPVARLENGQTLYRHLGSERLHELEDWLKECSDELFYRVPAYICRFLGAQCYDPISAQKLREAGNIYKELEGFLQQGKGLTRKQANRLDWIKSRMKGWESDWKKAFEEKFGEIGQLT